MTYNVLKIALYIDKLKRERKAAPEGTKERIAAEIKLFIWQKIYTSLPK